jgi:hypothetical protein
MSGPLKHAINPFPQPALVYDDGTSPIDSIDPPRLVTKTPADPMDFPALFPNGVPCDNRTKEWFRNWTVLAKLDSPWKNGSVLNVGTNYTFDTWVAKYAMGRHGPERTTWCTRIQACVVQRM